MAPVGKVAAGVPAAGKLMAVELVSAAPLDRRSVWAVWILAYVTGPYIFFYVPFCENFYISLFIFLLVGKILIQ